MECALCRRFVPHDELWALYLETSGNNLLTGIPGKARAYSDEGAQLAAYIIQNVTGGAAPTLFTSGGLETTPLPPADQYVAGC